MFTCVFKTVWSKRVAGNIILTQLVSPGPCDDDTKNSK